MTGTQISIVLPVDRADDALVGVLSGYADVLNRLGSRWEILLVPHSRTDFSQSYEQQLAIADGVRICQPTNGWGAAVRVGLNASRGDLLCYANWRRTSADSLSEMLDLAVRNPRLVLRANRRTRDTRIQRLGSLLFNVECRLLLQIPAWDVNGTPKVFPRSFGALLELRQSGDLLDAEFALACERRGYPVIEVPIEAGLQSSGRSRPEYRAALKMYTGVARLRGASGR